jgi:hypothetical protein
MFRFLKSEIPIPHLLSSGSRIANWRCDIYDYPLGHSEKVSHLRIDGFNNPFREFNDKHKIN